MKKTLIALAALALTGLAALALANITGAWEMTVVTPRGERKQDVSFVQDGEKLSVTMTMTMRDGTTAEAKGEGTVKGEAVEFKITRSTPRGDMTTVYKGKIVDDKTMAGTSEMAMGENVMTAEWTAVRKAQG